MNLRLESARNNAELCALVLRAQGRTSDFSSKLWTCPGAPLPFYPNIVTLLPGAQTAVQQCLSRLAQWPAGWGIKDSFADLDLKDLKFDPVREGTWLGLVPAETAVTPEGWTRVKTGKHWREWVEAWSSGGPVPFDRSLLDVEEVAFWAIRKEGRIVSGCLTNQSGTVTGFSNAFGPETEHDWWGSLVAGVRSVYPGPLVCWERDPASLGAPALGFQNLGPLRVWLKR